MTADSAHGVDRIYCRFGHNPDQSSIAGQGEVHLKNFPKLAFITSATIIFQRVRRRRRRWLLERPEGSGRAHLYFMSDLAGRKVKTVDNELSVFSARDVNSAERQLTRGSEIELATVSELQGREWVEVVSSGTAIGFAPRPFRPKSYRCSSGNSAGRSAYS